MRAIIFILIAGLVNSASFAQTSPPKPSSQKDLQGPMQEAVNALNKQIAELEVQLADAKKNGEDQATIKGIEDQIAMLKKQVEMMGGLKKSISKMPPKAFEGALEEGKNLIPRKDSVRINAMPRRVLSEAEVFSFVKVIHTDVEKLIPPAERQEAIKIYDKTKANYKSPVEISNAAAGCWIYGHWEKALWLAGRSCMDDKNDPDNLNNYASYLSMIGAEHAALPILQYLNKKYPDNSTILNNIGQAWFGLGDIPKAKKFLDSATRIYPNHSMANLTLSTIYLAASDTPRAVAALRRSIKDGYTTEKEAELVGLGAELDEDDIEFDYPMEEDPLGFEPFFNVFPSVPGSISETYNAIGEWDAFYEAANSLAEKTHAEALLANERTRVFSNKMVDSAYQQPVLKMHNGTVNIKAGRKLTLAIKKKTALSINDVMNLMANAFHDVTTTRLNALEEKRKIDMRGAEGCAAVDAVNNAFMGNAKAVITEGREAMIIVYSQNKRKVDKFLKLSAYSALNDYTEKLQKFTREIWDKNQWLFVYTANFTASYRSLLDRPPMYSSCDDKREPPKQTKQLPALKTPDCTYSDGVKLCIGEIKEVCNTCTIDESDLKFRQTGTQKGEISITIGEAVIVSPPGPQQASTASKTSTISCNKSGAIKVDRARPTRRDPRCTVNSERPGSFPVSVRMSGGSLAR